MEMEPVTAQAGAICIVNDRVVLLTNKNSTRWVIPKGHLEPTDSDYWARAVAESWEEGGVKCSDTETPYCLGEFLYRKGGGKLCKVRVFLLKNVTLAEEWPEKKLRKRILVSPKEAAKMVKEPELATMLKELGTFLSTEKEELR